MRSLVALCLASFALPAAAQSIHTVDVNDSAFAPAEVWVVEGDMVSWQWRGVLPHSTTSAVGQGESWDSGVLGNGDWFDKTFSVAGDYNYYCSVHGQDLGGGQVGGMSGTVHVLPPSGVVINEVLADPDAIMGDSNCDGLVHTTQDEFVEIVNTTQSPVDLSGLELHDAIGVRHVFPPQSVIQPGAALVVFGGGQPVFDGTSGVNEPWCVDLGPNVVIQTSSSGSLALNNGGDSLTLYDANMMPLDTAGYGAEGGNNNSLVREVELTHAPLVEHNTVSQGPWSPGTDIHGVIYGGPPPAPTMIAAQPAIAGQQNTIAVTGGPPNATATFIWGNQPQTGPMPLGYCPGVNIDVKNPKMLATAQTNANGDASVSAVAPASLSGNTLYMQVVFLGSCSVSNPTVTTFQ